MKPTVKKCADEGGQCTCAGNIFYGSTLDAKNKTIEKFAGIFDSPFHFLTSNGSLPVTCDSKRMADGDELFLEGTPKQCFCDDIGQMSAE